ncbi:MAG: iron chaperone [Thermomicrobiales bacterium]
MKDTQQSDTSATGKTTTGFSDEERAAMRERAKEVTATARRGSRANKADGESDVLAKIAVLPEADRVLAERLHALIKVNAPALASRTWYGMPAYTNKDDKVVCFFQAAEKFNTRYATLGFNDVAHLDDGAMWPVAYALTALTAADEARIAALLKQAVRAEEPPGDDR